MDEGARASRAGGFGDGIDDRGGRDWGYACLSDQRFSCGVYSGGDCGGDGTGDDCLGSKSVHGYSSAVGGVSGGGGRSIGVCGGDLDWELVRELGDLKSARGRISLSAATPSTLQSKPTFRYWE